MIWHLFYLLLPFIALGENPSAAKELSLIAADVDTKEAVENTHVFFANSSFGASTDDQGHVQMNYPDYLKEDLIVSHVAYETRVLSYSSYKNLKRADTIWLTPSAINIEDVVITSSRDRKWKKRFKKFRSKFLGEGPASKNTTILNAEVLRLEEKDGRLMASASSPLQIRNDYLGYELTYWLSHLTIEEDGSSEYLGSAQFELLPNENESHIKNRKQTYLCGMRYFLKSLIDNQLEENEFSIGSSVIGTAGFEKIGPLRREEVIIQDTISGYYHLRFTDFLQITDKKNKIIQDAKFKGQVGGLESSRFNNMQSSDNITTSFSKSYIYKISPSLVMDKNGNVLNSKRMQEYGAWAYHRVALMLPFDYNMLDSNFSDVPSDPRETQIQHYSELINLIYGDREMQDHVLELLDQNWIPDFIPPLIDMLRILDDQILSNDIVHLLQKRTGKMFGMDFYSWKKWLWDNQPLYDENYLELKSELYKHLDPNFENYFDVNFSSAKIRLDEIMWGGVPQDGIPQLKHPKMIGVLYADYLSEEDIVFGIEINGIPKAYPQRILAWHEFVVDSFGDIEVNSVYCTLCGTVIAYNSQWQDQKFQLGTSGFLYRSNKMMYDKSTQSLWSTIEGRPVLGELASTDIELETFPVVTTTWGAWKALHPLTQVLSLETGYNRDYNEGAAYKAYFDTDQLMFPVPEQDDRLKNKEEVYITRPSNYKEDPVAISTKYLRKKGFYQFQQAGTHLITLDAEKGGIRAYEAGSINFKHLKKEILKDEQGMNWSIHEEFLESETGERLNRVSGHQIFWFAWFNMYPEGRLIK